jgi:hypothetical protein
MLAAAATMGIAPPLAGIRNRRQRRAEAAAAKRIYFRDRGPQPPAPPPPEPPPPVTDCKTRAYRDGDDLVLDIASDGRIVGRLRTAYEDALPLVDEIVAVMVAIDADRKPLSDAGADLLAESIRNTEALEIARAASE